MLGLANDTGRQILNAEFINAFYYGMAFAVY